MRTIARQFAVDVLDAAASCLAPGAVGVLVIFFLGSPIDRRVAWLGAGACASLAIADFGRRVWRAGRSMRLRQRRAQAAELDRRARLEALAWHASDRAEAHPPRETADADAGAES